MITGFLNQKQYEATSIRISSNQNPQLNKLYTEVYIIQVIWRWFRHFLEIFSSTNHLFQDQSCESCLVAFCDWENVHGKSERWIWWRRGANDDDGAAGVECVFSLRIQVSDKEGISPIILFWWWDWNPQSYSREVSGFLGFCSSFCWWFRNPANSPVERTVVEIYHYLQGFFHTSQVVFDFPDFWTINSFSMGFCGSKWGDIFLLRTWRGEKTCEHHDAWKTCWYVGTTPPPRTPVTTRMISFLVGNPL